MKRTRYRAGSAGLYRRMLRKGFIRRGASCAILIPLVFCFSGCDTAPGPVSPIGRPPVLSNLEFQPQELNLLAVDPAEVEEGRIQVDLQVRVQATDSDDAIQRVVIALRPPVLEGDALLFGTVPAEPGNTFAGTYTVEFDTGLIGTYTIELYAVDEQELLSNKVLGTFELLSEGNPPVIESIDAPDTIQRPETGTSLIQLVAVVSDPDGLSNIANVVFWNVTNPQARIGLFDDGEQGGDEVADDGRYTVTIQIDNTAAPGVNRFAFQATDRSGLRSEIVTKEITVQ